MKKLLFVLLAMIAISASSYAFSLKMYIYTNEGQVAQDYYSPGCSSFYYQLHIYRAADDDMPWRWLYSRVNASYSNGTGIDYVLDSTPNPGQHLYKYGWSTYIPGAYISHLLAIVNASWGGYASAKVYW